MKMTVEEALRVLPNTRVMRYLTDRAWGYGPDDRAGRFGYRVRRLAFDVYVEYSKSAVEKG